MRLNLGCGDDVRDGYVNVDFRKTHESVLPVDLSIFPWPFEDDSADEILMLDFLEHFPYAQTRRILLECHRVLRDDGSAVIQVPDASILGRVLSLQDTFQCNACGMWIIGSIDTKCSRCKQSVALIHEAAMMRMFGGQDHHGNFHHACFTKQSLERKAFESGLVLLADEEQEQQAPNWNFKLRFSKGDPWNAKIRKWSV